MMIENLTKPDVLDFAMAVHIEAESLPRLESFIEDLKKNPKLTYEHIFLNYFWIANVDQKKEMAEIKLKSIKTLSREPDQGDLVSFCFKEGIDLSVFKTKVEKNEMINLNLLQAKKDPILFEQLAKMVFIVRRPIKNDPKPITNELELKADLLNILRTINKQHKLSLNTSGFIGVKELEILINIYEDQIDRILNAQRWD